MQCVPGLPLPPRGRPGNEANVACAINVVTYQVLHPFLPLPLSLSLSSVFLYSFAPICSLISATSERASPGSQSQKQILSPPSKPRQEQLRHHEENVREGQDGDTFSAALTALEKLEITSSVQSVEKDKQLSPEKSDKSSSKRELSPSVAAVFESVEAGGGSQASLSPAEVPTHARDDKEGPSMTLKAMLKMEEKGGHTNQGEREMPEAIQKLMQPASSPRGPLLPYPRPPLQPPQQAPIPRQPSSQFFPRPPRGELVGT